MKIINPNQYGKLDENRLIEFEALLGSTLPDDYRRYLIENNGGDWSPRIFHISEAEGESRIHHVYGLDDGPTYRQLDLVHKTFSGRMPQWCIPIADDEGGNQICISINTNDRGSVYFWDHETSGLVLLSPSFNTFIDSLIDDRYLMDELEKIIDTDDVEKLKTLISSGYDIESKDEYGRTMIERAAIKGGPEIIKYLADKGADFRGSLEFARQNAEFFEDHINIVILLSELIEKRKK